jgi:hypothetical protein
LGADDVNLDLIDNLWVQVEDDNTGCTDEAPVTINILLGPIIFPIDIEVCTSNASNYNLTQHDGAISPFGPITWWDGDPLDGGTQIVNPSMADLTSVGSLWVQATSGNGCTTEEEIGLDLSDGPDVNTITIEICTNEANSYNLTQHNDDISSDIVTWWEGQPSAGGSQIIPPTFVDLNGIVDLWVQVEDSNGCTSEGMIPTIINPAPMISDPFVNACEVDANTYDLTQHNASVSPSGTVTWWDGQPSAGGSEIVPASLANLNDIIELWAQVEDSNGCLAEIMVTLTINPGPAINSPFIEVCENEANNFDLTQFDSQVSSAGNVSWWNGQPSAGGTQVSNPSNANLNSIPSLWVQVDNGTCTSEEPVECIWHSYLVGRTTFTGR